MAQLVAVLDVVVHQREVVQQLDRRRRGERVLALRAFGLGRRDQDPRTQPLAALAVGIVEGEVLAHQRADRRRLVETFDGALEIRLERVERRSGPARYLTSTDRIEPSTFAGRIMSAAADASKPEWTMQSLHLGLPLAWPYSSHFVSSSSALYDVAYPSPSR